MRVVEAFAEVVASAERTRNAVRLLWVVILGAALLVGELCAAAALFSRSPAAGVSAGLLPAVSGVGIAAWSWVRARRKTHSSGGAVATSRESCWRSCRTSGRRSSSS